MADLNTSFNMRVDIKKCDAVQFGDRMRCARCDQSWDTNDISPPECVPQPVPGFLKVKAPKSAPDFLDAAAATFRERNSLYGNNYQREGALLLALFPEGGIPAIKTPEDANRLHVLVACVTKLQRYAHNWAEGGHQDSAHDLQVYAAMLEEFTSVK
jgi:hypothetical protein